MKVLFTARSSLFVQPGGDTQQVVQTAEELRKLGHAVDIKLRGEDFDGNAYDLIHFYNAGRPADINHLLPLLQKPFVVSSIWVDYSEWESMQKGFKGLLFKAFGDQGLEYFKTIARGLNGSDKFPNGQYILKGQKKSMKQLLQHAQVVIASSQSEKHRLDEHFGIAEKTEVIPLGLTEQMIGESTQNKRKGVISVGRIEGLKNQLNLIKAANDADWQLKVIGKPAANQKAYNRACQIAATNNVTFEGWLNAENLREAYQSAKAMVLPSYFETFGLVALEALANGCNLVLSNRPDMNDIFKGKALFCNPNDPDDIRAKIDEALTLPPPTFTKADYELYSWHNVALTLQDVYQKLINP